MNVFWSNNMLIKPAKEACIWLLINIIWDFIFSECDDAKQILELTLLTTRPLPRWVLATTNNNGKKGHFAQNKTLEYSLWIMFKGKHIEDSRQHSWVAMTVNPY